MHRLCRCKQASTPLVTDLPDDVALNILKQKSPALFVNDTWRKLSNTFEEGYVAEYGYQKTNEEGVFLPFVYLVEVHIFKHVELHDKYCAAAVVVPVNVKTCEFNTANAVVKTYNVASIDDARKLFDTTMMLDDDHVIKFDNFMTLDEAVTARNQELVDQGKYTEEEIDELMTSDRLASRQRRNEQ